jgi:hypothetical protein
MFFRIDQLPGAVKPGVAYSALIVALNSIIQIIGRPNVVCFIFQTLKNVYVKGHILYPETGLFTPAIQKGLAIANPF